MGALSMASHLANTHMRATFIFHIITIIPRSRRTEDRQLLAEERDSGRVVQKVA